MASEKKIEDEAAQLADTLRKTYSSYQDNLNRISLDLRTNSGLINFLYSQPKSTFVSSPEAQNDAINKLMAHVSKLAPAQPLTLFPDELHKRMREALLDHSSLEDSKEKLLRNFQRWSNSLNIQKFRLIQRLGTVLTQSGSLDQYMLIVNSCLQNLTFQSQMIEERCGRLKNDDMNNVAKKRLQLPEDQNSIYEEHKEQTENSLIRLDDIEVSLRISRVARRKRRGFDQFVKAIGWLPHSSSSEIWLYSRELINCVAQHFQKLQEDDCDGFKRQIVTDLRGTGMIEREAEVTASKYMTTHFPHETSRQHYTSESFFSGKYEKPPGFITSVSVMKNMMLKLGEQIGISCNTDINLDRGHSYCRELYYHFSRLFSKQCLESTFCDYESSADADQCLENYHRLAKQAEKEKGKCDYKQRLMQVKAFPSKLYSGERYFNRRMWRGHPSPIQEEILQTIATTIGTQLDKLLQTEIRWLDINDLPMIEELLDQASQNYCEKYLNGDICEDDPVRKIDLEDAADISALEALREDAPLFAIEAPPSKKGEWKHIVKSFFIERLIIMREYKRKIAYALNYFRGVERRLTHDIIEIASTHTSSASNLSIKSCNSKFQHPIKRKTEITDPGEKLLQPAAEQIYENSGYPLSKKLTDCPSSEELSNSESHNLLRAVKIDEDEVRLVDNQGVFVFLEPALEDLKETMQRLLQIGTYYIKSYENKQGEFSKSKKPTCDRGSILLDLLKSECEYQYSKLHNVELLMHIYEHSQDLVEIESIGQCIHDFISYKPRLHLLADYFCGSYKAEVFCCQNYTKLLEFLIIQQQQKEAGINSEILKGMEQKLLVYNQILQKKQSEVRRETQSKNPESSHLPGVKPTPELFDPYKGAESESYKKKLEDILELNPMEEVDLFETHKRLLREESADDSSVEALYEFISFREGWDCFAPKYCAPNIQCNSFCCYSTALSNYPIYSFYSSLSEITRVISAIKTSFDSMVKLYDPESGLAFSTLEAAVVRQALYEFEGVEKNSEDSVALGSFDMNAMPETDIFALKNLMSQLNQKNLYEINPEFICKMSVNVIKQVDFNGFNDVLQLHPKAENLKWPLLIKFACNLLELDDIREELLSCYFESNYLSLIYCRQQEFCSQHVTLINSNSIQFPKSRIGSKDYVVPKICSECTVNLAVQEFDSTLRNLACFHKMECLQHCFFDAGLEEIRGVLHYQLMQTQALTIAVQINNWLFMPYIRAFAELNGLASNYTPHTSAKKQVLASPSSILGLHPGEESRIYLKEKEKLREVMMSTLSSSFVNVSLVKKAKRSLIESAYQNFVNKLQLNEKDSGFNLQAVCRCLRSYKIYLLHFFCDHTMDIFYNLSLHIQVFEVCKSLKEICRMLPDTEHFLDCQKSYGLELVPYTAHMSQVLDDMPKGVFMNPCDINRSLLTVPSTEDIAQMIKVSGYESFSSKVKEELNFDHPEELIKTAVEFETCERALSKEQKQSLHNEKQVSLLKYDSFAYNLLMSLVAVRNIFTIETCIEGINIPLHNWLQLYKYYRMNIVPWNRPSGTSSSALQRKISCQIEEAVKAEIQEDVRLSHLAQLLRNVTNKIRVMDYTLYKTCGYKFQLVIDYLTRHYKYKYLCLTESLYKVLDEMPFPNGGDSYFNCAMNSVNFLTHQRIGEPIYISENHFGPTFFRLYPRERMDKSLREDNNTYITQYYRALTYERHSNPEILKIIHSDLVNTWQTHRLKLTSERCGFPAEELQNSLFGLLSSEDVRKMLISHIALVEGKAQIEYGGRNEEVEEDEFCILPVEVVKLDDLKEQHRSLKEKMRLRRFRFAFMAWFTQFPTYSTIKTALNQRKIFTEKTFIPLMTVKEEIKFEAEKQDIPTNTRLRQEALAEIKIIKHLISKDILLRGIEAVKIEQGLITEMLDKGSSKLESSFDAKRGTAATLFGNVDPEQRKCLLNSMHHLQTFVTQIRNRSTMIESLTTGTAMIVTLHDFNSSLYQMCQNLWQQMIAQYRSFIWGEKKMQQQLHHKAHVETVKRIIVSTELEQLKANTDHRIAVEVGQRCYEQIYEVEKSMRLCQFWKEKLNAIEIRIRKQLKLELRSELNEKELLLKNYESQFKDYKETLMAQLKSEISSNNLNLTKKFQVSSKKSPSSPQRNSVNLEECEEVAEAYAQLSKLQEKVHKLRIFYNMRMVLMKSRLKTKIGQMREQMTTNGKLWNELSLAERREVILKQELVNTQQNLAACERALKQLQVNLKDKNSALMRYQQSKTSNAQRLEELESKLKRFSFSEVIDVNQLKVELQRKERELLELRGAVTTCDEKIESVKVSHKTQIKQLQMKLQNESKHKTVAMKKIEELQVLLQQATTKPAPGQRDESGPMWKEKCKELVEICKALKNENELLRQFASDPSRGPFRGEESKDSRVDTPYSQGFSSAVSRVTPVPHNSIFGVLGTHKQYSNKPSTRGGVQTRSSSHSGMNKSFSGRTHSGMSNSRPQTQHHPYLPNPHKRLNSGIIKDSLPLPNITAYP